MAQGLWAAKLGNRFSSSRAVRAAAKVRQQGLEVTPFLRSRSLCSMRAYSILFSTHSKGCSACAKCSVVP